jgi:hypothetical protein
MKKQHNFMATFLMLTFLQVGQMLFAKKQYLQAAENLYSVYSHGKGCGCYCPGKLP